MAQVVAVESVGQVRALLDRELEVYHDEGLRSCNSDRDFEALQHGLRLPHGGQGHPGERPANEILDDIWSDAVVLDSWNDVHPGEYVLTADL